MTGLVGKRIRLVFCTDPYTDMEPGLEGTVRFVDDVGTVFVDWDSGSKLGLVPGEDSWQVLEENYELRDVYDDSDPPVFLGRFWQEKERS